MQRRFFNKGAEASDLSRRLRWLKNNFSVIDINKCQLVYEKENQKDILLQSLAVLEKEQEEEDKEVAQNRNNRLLKLPNKNQEMLDPTQILKLHLMDKPIKPGPLNETR
jgi:hypothetical protein